MGGKFRYLCVNSDCQCRTNQILFVLIGICVTNIVGCRLNTPATTSLTLATPTPTDTFIKRTLQLAFLQSPTQFGELWISSAFEAKVTRPTCTISENCTEGSCSCQRLPNIILAFIIHQSPLTCPYKHVSQPQELWEWKGASLEQTQSLLGSKLRLTELADEVWFPWQSNFSWSQLFCWQLNREPGNQTISQCLTSLHSEATLGASNKFTFSRGKIVGIFYEIWWKINKVLKEKDDFHYTSGSTQSKNFILVISYLRCGDGLKTFLQKLLFLDWLTTIHMDFSSITSKIKTKFFSFESSIIFLPTGLQWYLSRVRGNLTLRSESLILLFWLWTIWINIV